MKKFIIIFTLVFVSLSIWPASNFVSADTSDEGIDVIVLIDESGSMAKSDEDKLAITATKILLDKLDKQNDRILVIGFKENLDFPFGPQLEGPLDISILKRLHDGIDDIRYAGMQTDYGLALVKAVEILEKESFTNSKRNPVVILLSDGELEATNERAPYAEQDVYDSIDKLAGYGCNVYTIGLFENGQEQSAFEPMLITIADTTGGKYLVADSGSDLPNILSEILSDHRDEKIQVNREYEIFEDQWTEVKFTISDSYVTSTDITMVTDHLIDYELINPDGDIIDLMNDLSVYYNYSDKYVAIQLLKPIKGEWVLKVKAKTKDYVKRFVAISYVHSYDLQPAVSLSKTSGNGLQAYSGEDYVIVGQLEEFGLPVTDYNVYDGVNAVKLYAKKVGQDDADATTQMMIFTGTQYEATITGNSIGEYEYWCEIDHQNFNRVSPHVVVEAVNKPVPTKEPTTTSVPNEVEEEPFTIPYWVWIIAAGIVAIITFLVVNYIKSGGYFFKKKRSVRLSAKIECELENSSEYFIMKTSFSKKINYITVWNLINKAHDFSRDHSADVGPKGLKKMINSKQKAQLKKIILVPGNSSSYVIVESIGSSLSVFTTDTSINKKGVSENHLLLREESSLKLSGLGIKNFEMATMI